MSKSDLQQLQAAAKDGLDAVQKLQRRYDDIGWRVEHPPWAKLRHILLHLSKVNAKIARLVEPVEHALYDGQDVTAGAFLQELNNSRRLAAELLFHAAQVANLGQFDLSDELQSMYRENAQRFAPDSEFATT